MRRFNLRKSRTWAGIPSTFNKTAKTRSTVTEQPRFNIVCAQKTGRGCTLGRCRPCSKCSYDIFVSDQDIMRYPERGDYVYVSGRGSPPNAFGIVEFSTGRYHPDDPPTAYDFNISLDGGRCTMPPIVTCITVLTSCGDLNIHNKALMDDRTQEDCEGASLFHIKKVDEPATKGGNVGAPYRAPLAGARRQGVCCHHDIACLNHRCALVFSIRSVVGAMPTVGALVTTKGSVRTAPRRHAATPQGRPLGAVDKVVKTPGGGVLVIIVYNGECKNYIYLGESLVIGEKTYDPPVLQFYGTRSWLENCLRQPKKPIRTIYNDNYNKSCAGSSVCYDRRIRSGMQPKQKKCCKIKSCIGDCPCRPTPRKYSYSYYQYRQNSACTSFKRSEEKFPYRGLGGSCPPANGNKVPCQKSRYRKSGCQGCDSCDYGADETGRRPFGTAVTTYKPSNKKFQVQGAVTSGGRIERLKLDAIRASASKCPKGKRCTDIQGTKYGKGPYLAGKPAFRGRMYNALHLETTCTRRYKPVPFGIPQLVGNRRRATRNYRLQTVKGNPDKPALGNIVRRGSGSARAPGCKCGDGPEMRSGRIVCGSHRSSLEDDTNGEHCCSYHCAHDDCSKCTGWEPNKPTWCNASRQNCESGPPSPDSGGGCGGTWCPGKCPPQCHLPLCQKAMRKCLVDPEDGGKFCLYPRDAPITWGVPGKIWAPAGFKCTYKPPGVPPVPPGPAPCASVGAYTPVTSDPTIMDALSRVNVCVGGDFQFIPPDETVCEVNNHMQLVRDRWVNLDAPFQDNLSAAGFFNMWLTACSNATTPPRLTYMLPRPPVPANAAPCFQNLCPSSWIFVTGDESSGQIPQAKPKSPTDPTLLYYIPLNTFVCRIVLTDTTTPSGYSGVDYVIQSDMPFYCSSDTNEQKKCCGVNAKYHDMINAPIYFCGGANADCDGTGSTIAEAVTRTDGNLTYFTRRWM